MTYTRDFDDAIRVEGQGRLALSVLAGTDMLICLWQPDADSSVSFDLNSAEADQLRAFLDTARQNRADA